MPEYVGLPVADVERVLHFDVVLLDVVQVVHVVLPAPPVVADQLLLRRQRVRYLLVPLLDDQLVRVLLGILVLVLVDAR